MDILQVAVLGVAVAEAHGTYFFGDGQSDDLIVEWARDGRDGWQVFVPLRVSFHVGHGLAYLGGECGTVCPAWR